MHDSNRKTKTETSP
jgi:hypothetical protein